MRIIIILVLLIFPGIAPAQLMLHTATYEAAKQDSLLNYFIQCKEEYAKRHIDLSGIDETTTILKVNILDVSDVKSFDLSNSRFLKGLGFNKSLPKENETKSVLLVTNPNGLIYCFSLIAPDDELIGISECDFDAEFQEQVRIYRNKFSLAETQIFYIAGMPQDIYFLQGKKILVVDNGKITDAIPYLKKRYKNKKMFLQAYNVWRLTKKESPD